MINKIKEPATSYAKDAAMDFVMTSAKKAVLGTPSEVQVSVNQHAKDTKKDTSDILSSFLPKIQSVVMSAIGNQVLTDPVLEVALRTAYALVPGGGVLRLIITEEKFVAMCMAQKSSFFPDVPQEVTQVNNAVGTALVDSTVEPTPAPAPAPAPVTANTPTKIFGGLGGLSNNNHKIYENLIPELIAFCIASNGVVQDSEVKMAVSIINNDEMIRNKKKSLQSLSAYIKINMDNKRNAEDLFELSQSSLMAKIAKLENPVEKRRVDLIIESMLSSVQEITVANSQATANAMRSALA